MSNLYGNLPVFSFRQNLNESDEFLPQIKSILKKHGAQSFRESTLEENKLGIDLWAIGKDGKESAIEYKTRRKVFKKDWICLEAWSVLGQKPGWTVDPAKKTDWLIIYYDSGEYFLIPFKPLRKAYNENFGYWNRLFNYRIQDNRGYQSASIYVPLDCLMEYVPVISNFNQHNLN